MADSPTPEHVVPGAVYRTLLQFALLGTELGDHRSARTIADALRELRPDLPQAGIVLAMTDFCGDAPERGIALLETTLDRFPDSQLAKAMLAVCLKTTDRRGWQPLLESVIADGRDEYAIGLACELLGRDNTWHEPDASAEEEPALPGLRTGTAPNDVPAHALWV